MDKHDLVGKTFIARKSYPFINRGSKSNSEDFSYDFKTGESILVKEYDDETNEYLVWNLNLDENGLAWVKLTEDDMLKTLRKSKTK